MATDRDGALVYRVRLSPDALPPVRSGDLADGWEAAHRAAMAATRGEPRRFRFQPDDDEPIDLALSDADASCWAEAVDAAWGLNTAYGLSLCLRLLGLVTLLSDSTTVRAFCRVSNARAQLDPALIRAVATVPLSARGHLDEQVLCAHLERSAPPTLPIVH